MNTDTAFNYSDGIMRQLYALHQREGKDNWLNYEGFRASLIDYLDDIGVAIFHLLPRIDLPDDDVFFEDLDDEELEQLSGLANLLGIDQKDCPFKIIPNIMPDIAINMDDGCLEISNFQTNYPSVFSLGDEVVDLIWDHFTVEQIQGFSEEQQRVFLRLVDLSDYDFSQEDNIASHKRLVFGLHIPQDLKDYHDECVYELGVRMLADPLFKDYLDIINDKIEAENKNVLFLQQEEDKRTMVAYFMMQLADIWQIPRPVEEDYSEEPQPDKEGKEFSSFMHAFYRAAANDNKPSGLIFGTNTHKGYLQGDQKTVYTLEALAHEFGHLIVGFMMKHQTHQPWHDYEDTARLIRENTILGLPEIKDVMKWNKSTFRNEFYYQAVDTDFTGLPKITGKHVYSGQLEERHADYVGEKVSDMVEFCLNVRGYFYDVSKAKLEFKSMAKSILNHLGKNDEQKDIREFIETLFDTVKTDQDLQESYDVFMDYTQNWIDENIDMNEEQRRREELQKNGDNITTRNLFAIKLLEDFRKFSTTFFELRERAVDSGYGPMQRIKNALSL